jgi:hypothetical protein
MKYTIFALFSVFTLSVAAQGDLIFEDHVYRPTIKTVQLYPDGGVPQDVLSSPAAPLGAPNLVIEFDDLQANRTNYYVRLIHCNYDWTKSNLNDLDFLNDYNEFPITDYSFAGGTFQPYVHYRFQIPPVKVAGNYLVIAYQDDQSHLIISKRMMIYTTSVSILQDKQNTGSTALSFTTQPLNFVVDYSQLEILNPMENVHVVIRQNQRWDNAKFDVKPSFLRDADNQMEFRSMDQKNSFAGGNEFRFVDFKSLNAPGQNTGRMNKTVRPWQLSVAPDKPRIDEDYAQYNDMDGNYKVDNADSGDGKTGANYLPVTFFLKWDIDVGDPVYVIGAFNCWARTNENLLKYDSAKAAYTATVQLKQGLYNYQYMVDSKSKKTPPNYFEGDHFETENQYEILVYNRTFQPNADQLVGYYTVTVNPR